MIIGNDTPTVAYCCFKVENGQVYKKDAKIYNRRMSAVKRCKILNETSERPNWQALGAAGWFAVEG